MKLHFPAVFTVLFDLKLSFAFCIHVDLVPVCNVVLVFTNGTDKCHKFSRSFFCHTLVILHEVVRFNNNFLSLGRELNSLLLSYQESVLPMNYLGAGAKDRIRTYVGLSAVRFTV